MKKDEEKKENLKNVLEELRRAFSNKLIASDMLDAKLQNILDYSSIIFVVVSAITASVLLDRLGILYWFGLLIVLGLYIFTVLKIKEGQMPATFQNPISIDYNDLQDVCVNVTEEKSLDNLIIAHIHSIKKTGEILAKKDAVIQVSSNIMVCMVILLFVSIFLGLVFPNPTLSCFLHLASCVKGVTP